MWANLRKEAPGLEVNESFWQAVDRIVLTRTTFASCYAELADRLDLAGDYWTQLRRAMNTWAGLFDGQA